MIQLKTNQSISSKVNRTIPFNYPAYTYNTPKNRLTSAGGSSFSYDNEGQLSSGYGANYTFDYEHRLTAIGSTQFTYDGSGNRLQAVRSGTTTRYIYDPAGNVLAEADGNNTITRIYVYGQGLLAMVLPATQQDQVYCYHYNATGSTIAVTDGSQTVVNKYAYDPFGNILSQQENIGGQDARLQNQPFKFVGQFGVMAEPNGFYYMRARYYDPNVGRFISEDPIGFDGGDVNLMAYVGNNPVNGIDPEGTAPVRQIIKALEKVHSLVGGSLPKGKPGKFGSPQRGTAEKGYRLDPAHPNAEPGSPESVEHINWWDYTGGKKGKGGRWDAEAIVGVAVGFIGSFLDPFDAISGELAGPEYDMIPMKRSGCGK